MNYAIVVTEHPWDPNDGWWFFGRGTLTLKSENLLAEKYTSMAARVKNRATRMLLD